MSWPTNIFREDKKQDKPSLDKAVEAKVAQKIEQKIEQTIAQPTDSQQIHNACLDSKQNALDALRAKLESFDKLQFKVHANNLVFSDGNSNAKLMLIGEAPGEEEDKLGKPFVGKSGKLLSQFLESIVDEGGKYDRTRYYITNIIPWRPPGNRTPTADEVELMRPFVLEHISIIDPVLIVPVGAVALKAMGLDGITSKQGKLHQVDLGSIVGLRNIFPVYHPSYALRVPSKKRDLWLSLLKMQEVLKEQEHKQLGR